MRAFQFATTKNPSEEIVKFLRFVCEFLEIKTLPKIIFIKSPIKSEKAVSFAAFQPSNNKIMLYIKNRHILDVFRSLAHEMVHFKQSQTRDDLNGETGSPDENEANSLAGQIMRLYGKQHPELY